MTARNTSAPSNLPTRDELNEMLSGYVDVAQRLQQTHETLQREVVRLRDELASKDRELERRRRLASLGELAAGVAHEVRNPLGAISLYSGLLRDQCRDSGPALELIEKIDAGIEAIDGVVQDTLALAPRGGRLTRYPLRAIVDRACDVCLGVLDAAQVRVETLAPDSDVMVAAHADALQRVFVNLIANAAQAAPAGTVVTVEITVSDACQAEVHVIDDGPGLAPEVLDRVFDPFFTTKQQGTGLGLTIAHRLVEAHGGKLVARNRDAGGAEFIVELPTKSGESEPGAPVAGASRTTAA
jgi:signal transduction histidine kinase